VIAPRFEVYPGTPRRRTTMEHIDRLRAVIAIQQEVVAAGLDPDAVARLVAERAQSLVHASGSHVELVHPDTPIERRTVVLDGTARVPLIHEDSVCGVLEVRDADLGPEELELLDLLASVAAAQLCHCLAYAQAWRDGRLDAVTGLLNRRAYDETLARETSRARRHQRELALCLFDLDDFKAVNDNQGHLAGDDVLREFAEVLAGVRGEDFAFRVGGDEFALVLPETDLEGAEIVARRLLERSTVPASVGTASAMDAAEPQQLHAAADAELYDAKRRRA
jgi:diguanylate cyclase (GGDEF)-like protein